MRRGILSVFGVAGAAFAAAAIFELSRLGAPSAPVLPAKAPPAPAAPASPSPATAAAQAAPSFDIVKVAPDGTAVLAGRAEPGARVTVLDGNKPIGAVTADPNGEWVLVPEARLPPGDRQLRLEATGPGGQSLRSRQTVALAIVPPAAGKGATALAVVLPQGAGTPATVLQRPDGAPAAGGLSLDVVEYDAKGGLALSGHAAPGASLELYLDNRPLASAKADAGGRWTATAVPPAGRGELRLDEIGADGKVARRITAPLLPAVAAKLQPGELYTVQPGNSLWQIARRSYGSGLHYVLIYSANLARIRNPDLIYPGQVIRLPKS